MGCICQQNQNRRYSKKNEIIGKNINNKENKLNETGIDEINDNNMSEINEKENNEIDEKIQKIENELRKENYKLKIQKDNNIKNVNKEKKKENNEEKKFKIMPKEIIRRKGFSNNWIKC